MTQLYLKITVLSENDTYYPFREALIGKTGTTNGVYDWEDGWFSSLFFEDLKLDEPVVIDNVTYTSINFHEFKYELVKSCKKRQKVAESCKKRQK
jgi:hypothetical protein